MRRASYPGPKGLAALLLLVCCSSCSSDQLNQLVGRLDDPLRREEAIAGLLQLVERTAPAERPRVRIRAVDALMASYREDESRAEIVAALAALGDPRAAPVFAAALRDFERGGAYLEASVRSARALGAFGLKQEVPTLVEVLGQTLSVKQQEQTIWLKRALIEALDRLGDSRAVEILVRVLRGDPARQDFYLNKQAASALGRLRDRRAIRPLVAALSSASHGLLLYEESRRALCRIGPESAAELLAVAARRDRRGQPESNATAAARVLGDLDAPGAASKLAALDRAKEPVEYRLALAEARLRLGDREAETALREVISSGAALTARRWAADLSGWYGTREGAEELLRTHCLEQRAKRAKRVDSTKKVLCWGLALAYARLAPGAGLAQFDALRAAADLQTSHYLQTYRPRLELGLRCGEEIGCYRKELQAATDWRMRERSALELGRLGGSAPAVALELAAGFADAHPQVKEAILIALERWSRRLDSATARAISARLTPSEASPRDGTARSGETTGGHAVPPSTASRALCLSERLGRIAGTTTGGDGRQGAPRSGGDGRRGPPRRGDKR